MEPITIKILAYKRPQRYVMRRVVSAALETLQPQLPDLQVDVVEVTQRAEIEAYTSVIIYPSLVVNETLVCAGRFPRKDEVTGWLRQALDKKEPLPG